MNIIPTAKTAIILTESFHAPFSTAMSAVLHYHLADIGYPDNSETSHVALSQRVNDEVRELLRDFFAKNNLLFSGNINHCFVMQDTLGVVTIMQVTTDESTLKELLTADGWQLSPSTYHCSRMNVFVNLTG